MDEKKIKAKIVEWFEKGELTSNTHLLVIENLKEKSMDPYFVNFEEDITKTIIDLEQNQDFNLVEIYNLEEDLEPQLNEYKSWNI